MAVLTAPDTTTRSSPRSRPRRWPSNADATARRRSVGHGDIRTPMAAPPTLMPPVDNQVEAPAGRHGAQVLHRRHVTALDRARLALVAALFAVATAAAAVPARDDPGRGTTPRPLPAVTPAATTAPCSPVAVDCCPGAAYPIDTVRALRPACP
mgnify:CR=1 FL=1